MAEDEKEPEAKPEEPAEAKEPEKNASEPKAKAAAKSSESEPSEKPDEAEEPDDKDEEKKQDKKPSSPWPSAHKSEKPAAPAAAAAASVEVASAAPAEVQEKAAWAAPLDRLDRAWTKLDARLCAGVLVAEVLTLVFWISIKALSSSGNAGSGMIFRSMLTGLVLGVIAWRALKKHDKREQITTAAVVAGLVLGRYWGDAGSAYFANVQAWLQNASILVFFGGASDVAKRLTLWLALLGASVATSQGKHINVDVVMRFLTPRARVPLAVLGWMTAAIVCVAGVWGFFDHVAVEDFRVATSMKCPGDETKQCPTPPGAKIDRVMHDVGRDFFLAGRQLSLDLRTFPKVLFGSPYAKTMTPKEWNEWLKDGGWEKHFEAADVKALEITDDTTEYRSPAVTSVPGASERIHMLLVRELNFVFAFGLLVIAIRFVLRSLLAISGWVKVDPNAAHGDEELAHIHDHSPEAEAADAAIKEAVR